MANDPLRLRQTTETGWDIDGIPGTTAPEAAAQMLPAIMNAMTGGSLPDTSGVGTDASTTGTGVVAFPTIAPLNIDIPPINVVSVKPVDFSDVVIKSLDFTQAVADVLAANPTPYLGTPQQPSAPVVTPMPGALLVVWDGKNADGTIEKTPDWDRLEVHLSETSTFVPTTKTLVTTIHALRPGQVGQAIYASTRYGVNQYVRFVAVGRSGAASVPSITSVGQPAQMHLGDLGGDVTLAMTSQDSRHHIF